MGSFAKHGPALIELFATGGGGAGLQGFTLEEDRRGDCTVDKHPVSPELFAAGGITGQHGFTLKED